MRCNFLRFQHDIVAAGLRHRYYSGLADAVPFPDVGGAIFALLLNFEPVVILLLAWIVIGEALSAERIAGMAMIVFALFLNHWRLARTRPQSTGVP